MRVYVGFVGVRVCVLILSVFACLCLFNCVLLFVFVSMYIMRLSKLSYLP